MTSQKIILGRDGEDLAVDFLKRRGYRIIQRNFRFRRGEIDIIAKEGDTLCFIEVKARTTNDFGTPLESITFWKQRKLSKLALAYLKRSYQDIDRKARFDVVSVISNDGGEKTVEIIKDAFEFCR